MNLHNRQFLKSEEGRKFIIKNTIEAVPKEKNWQCFHTPYELCEKMISKTTVEGKTILVLFNLEFLETLIYKFGVPTNYITFIADCDLEGHVSKLTYNVETIIFDKDKQSLEEMFNNMKKFDLCFSNPPYGRGSQHTHLNILLHIIPLCKEIIYVHPIGWLFKKKPNTKKKFLDVKKELENRLKEIEVFNPNIVFNIDQVDPCAIEHIVENSNIIKINYFNQNIYEVSDVNDITIFCDKWNTIVKPFKYIIENYINKNGNIFLWEQRIKNTDDLTKIDSKKFFCQFTAMQPGTGDKTGRFMHGEDLYKVINHSQEYIVEYKNINNKYGMLVYWFNSYNEITNFLNYLKTDFVRFCLSIYKTSQSLDDGHMNLIPVMDFTRPWTDHDLYEYFNIPQETRDYITNFFPDDIYGLRGNNDTTK